MEASKIVFRKDREKEREKQTFHSFLQKKTTFVAWQGCQIFLGT
jgi:hypothetical protein